MLARKRNKSKPLDKNANLNARLSLLTDFFNDKIDVLFLLCEKKQIPQTEMADAMGVSRQAIYERFRKIHREWNYMEGTEYPDGWVKKSEKGKELVF